VDPCAGEGDALKHLGQLLESKGEGLLAQTFGVELEKERAEIAEDNLDVIVKGGYEWLRASNEVFSAMYLNPPYDHEAKSSENSFSERTEVKFLRDLTAPGKYLQPGGLLVYCIPQHVLKDAASLLATRFQNIQVYRFTDENYPTFKQVIVFGHRRESSKKIKTKDEREWLESLTEADLPPLDTPDDSSWLVPEANGKVKLFRGSLMDPEEIMKDVEGSSTWDAVDKLLLPPSARKRDGKLKRPILPLKQMHMGTAIAAGLVGGNMGSHYLEGITRKVASTRTEATETGRKEVTEERHVTIIRVFSPEFGVVDLE